MCDRGDPFRGCGEWGGCGTEAGSCEDNRSFIRKKDFL